MRQGNAVRRVNVHGLRFRVAGTARSGISNMADTDIPFEALHVLLLEDISDQAIAFAQVQFMAIAGNHARSVLSAMLQNSQSVVNLLIYRTTGDDADDATHNLCPCSNLSFIYCAVHAPR